MIGELQITDLLHGENTTSATHRLHVATTGDRQRTARALAAFRCDGTVSGHEDDAGMLLYLFPRSVGEDQATASDCHLTEGVLRTLTKTCAANRDGGQARRSLESRDVDEPGTRDGDR